MTKAPAAKKKTTGKAQGRLPSKQTQKAKTAPPSTEGSAIVVISSHNETYHISSSRKGEENGGLLDNSMALQVLKAEGYGNDEALTDGQRFVSAVNKWISAWIDITDETVQQSCLPCVFLYSEHLKSGDACVDLGLAPGFRQTFDHVIDGKLYVGALELKKVRQKSVGFTDSQAALAWIAKHINPDCTAVVFVPKMKQALIKHAEDDIDDLQSLFFSPPSKTPFDLSQVSELLEKFHEEWTSTHLAYCRIWAIAAKRKLKPGPEAQIQGALQGYFDFVVRPRGVLVEEEFHTRRGRGDVRLVHMKNNAMTTCVMELKVLRHEKGVQGNIDWAMEGLQQIVDYRSTEKVPGPSYLCCFDARHVDEDILEVIEAAEQRGVEQRRYFMQTPGCAASVA